MTLVAFEELKWIGACHSSRGKPTGSHGTQPRAANSVSSIHPTLPNAHWRKATMLQPTSQSLCASSSLACLHTCCHTVSCGRKAGKGEGIVHLEEPSPFLEQGRDRWVGTLPNGFSQASPVFIEGLNEGFRRQGGGRKAPSADMTALRSRFGRKPQPSLLPGSLPVPELWRGRKGEVAIPAIKAPMC